MLRFKCVHDGYPSNRKSGRKCNGVDEKGREGMDVLLVGEYLKQNGYSDSFRGGYLMSMAMSIWSTPLGDCDPGLSAHFVIYFMHYHHLLRLTGKAKYYHRWKHPIRQEYHCADATRDVSPLDTHPICYVHPPADAARQTQSPLTDLYLTRRRVRLHHHGILLHHHPRNS